MTFDYEGNAIVVKEVNVVIERSQIQNIVQNAFKIIVEDPEKQAIDEAVLEQEEQALVKKRLEPPKKLDHPINVIRSKSY